MKQLIAEPAAPAAQVGCQVVPVRWVLTALSLSMVLSSLGTSIANVALPTLAQVFHASFQQVQWVVLAYLLAITALIVGAGRLGDLVGRKRLLLAGILVFTAASALCGLAPSLGWLVLARALQGLGAAAMMALTMAFVGETVPKAQSGSAMGLLGTMSAVGTALGPSLGGVLIAAFGWEALFLVNLPLGALTFLLAWRHLPPDRPRSASQWTGFDPLGTLLLALALSAYALAMTWGRGSFGAINIALLLAAACAAALFVQVERRAAVPLVRLAMFRDTALRASLATSALVATVMMATLVVGPFHLAQTLGLGAALVGFCMSVGPLAAALTGVPAGRMVDRWGADRTTTAGLLSMLAGAVLLGVLPHSLGIPGYIAPMALLAVGYAVFQTANNSAVMGHVPPDQRGVVSGLLGLSRNLGLISGASLMGTVFAWAGMRVTFLVAAGLVGTALVLSIRTRR